MYFLFVLIITSIAARPCTKINDDQLVFTATSNEILTIDLQIYGEQNSGKFELTDDSKRFQINPPIWLIESTISSVGQIPNPITDLRVIKNKFNQWENVFGLIGIVGDKYYFYKTILTDETINYRLPQFNSNQILQQTNIATYSEFVFIDAITIIIDSTHGDEFFFELWIQTNLYSISNQFPNLTQPRHLLNSKNYIYRWTPKIDENPALIQIYSLDQEQKTIVLVRIIDQIMMQELVKDTIQNYQFDLVQLQVSMNDEIAYIDSSGYFIILTGIQETLTVQIKLLQQQKPISFDYNFEEQDLIVAFDQSLEYLYNNQDIIIPFPNISEYKVHLFQAFAVLVNNLRIILLNEEFKEIYRLEGDFTSTIFDFDTNDFISIQNQDVNHYVLYPEFRLQYQSDKNDEDNWSQSILKKGDCSLTLIFRNVDKQSNTMYQYGNISLIQSAIFSQQTEQPINRLVHGPNIKLEMKQQGFVSHKVKLDIKYQQSQQLEINFDDVIYTQIYYVKSQKKKFIINQSASLKISLFACSSEIPTIVCEQKLEFPAVVSLENKNVLIHYQDQKLIILYLNGLDLIIHKITITNTEYKQQQTTERLKEEYSITQILNTDQYLLLFSPEKKLISIYDFFEIDNGELYLIDATSFSQHSKKEWSPISISANVRSDWIYVYSFLNTPFVYIIDLHIDHFHFLFSDQIRNVDTRILIFKNQFGVLQQEPNKSVYLYLYRIDHPARIFSEKTIVLSNQQIDIESIFTSSGNSVLYVQLNSTTLMTYFTEENAHNSLINIVQIDAKKVICSQSYLYLINNNQSTIMEVYRQPHLLSSVQFVSNTNVFDLTEKLFYTNTLTEEVIPLQTNLRFINDQQQLYVMNYDNQIQIKEANQTNNISYLGNTWYQGQGYLFELNQSMNGISIIQPLIQLNDSYLPFDQPGKQIVIINENILIILYDQRFSAIDPRAPTFVKSYPFKDPITTVSIVYNSDGYMYIQILNNTQYEILAAKCEINTCEGNSNTLIAKGLVNDIQIINQTMFVIYKNNEIDVYQLVDRYFPKEAILLGTVKINEKDQGIRLQLMYKKYYLVFSNNEEGYLNIVQLTVEEQNYSSKQLQSIDLLTIANQRYYLSYQSHRIFPFMDVYNMLEQQGVIKLTLLFYSNNEKHIGFDFDIVCNEDNCTFKKTELSFVLQGYSEIVSQPLLVNKQIIVPYQIKNTVLLSIYKLPQNYSINPQISFFGAVKILKPSTNLQYLILQNKNEVNFLNIQNSLLFYDDEILQYYQINDGPVLNLNNEIKEQSFDIKVSNDFDNTKSNFTIKIAGNDDVDTQKSLLWLWITLGIIGVLILGGLGFYLFKKNKKTGDSESHLLG